MTPISDFGVSKVSKAALKVSKDMQKSVCAALPKLGKKCCRLGVPILKAKKF